MGQSLRERRKGKWRERNERGKVGGNDELPGVLITNGNKRGHSLVPPHKHRWTVNSPYSITPLFNIINN